MSVSCVQRWIAAVLADDQLQWLLQPARSGVARAHVGSLVAASALALLLLLLYLILHVRRPHLMYARTPLNTRLVHVLHRLTRAYWPTPYLTHEIAQAAVGSFVRIDPRIKRDKCFEREVLRMRDGELLALDWLHPKPPAKGVKVADDAPVVFVLHGLAGHSEELNMQYLALEVRATGARFALLNRRGCAHDMVLQGDKIYQYGCTSDMRECLAHIKQRYPAALLLGVGYSAGSNLLTKYLGESGADSLVDAGFSVANGFDLKATSEALHQKPFYARIMVNILKNMLTRNEPTFRRVQQRHEHQAQEEAREDAVHAVAAASPSPSPDPESPQPSSPGGSLLPRLPRRPKLNLAQVRKVRSVLEWDQAFSMPTCDAHYASLDEFYQAQSTTPELIARIARPLFCIRAMDDPIIPSVVVPSAALLANPLIVQATTHRGGHLGFAQGLNPFNKATWMEQLTGEWVRAISQDEQLRDAMREARLAAAAVTAATSADRPVGAAASTVEERKESSAAGAVDAAAAAVAHGHDLGSGHNHGHSEPTAVAVAAAAIGLHSRQSHQRMHSHPLAPAPLQLGLSQSSTSHGIGNEHSSSSLQSLPLPLPPSSPSSSDSSAHQSVQQAVYSASLLQPLATPLPLAAIAHFQPSPRDDLAAPSSSASQHPLVPAESPLPASQGLQYRQISDDSATSSQLAESPMLPLTPHAQPHGFSFPALSAAQEQQAAAASHSAPFSSLEAAHQSLHVSDRMDFSLDPPQPSSADEEDETKHAPVVPVTLDEPLSPAKRRKLNGVAHTQAAAGTGEDAAENEPDATFSDSKLSLRRTSNSASTSSPSSNGHGKGPTRNGSTPLKRKK